MRKEHVKIGYVDPQDYFYVYDDKDVLLRTFTMEKNADAFIKENSEKEKEI